MKTIIRECDGCGNKDSIDCESGLCPECRKEYCEICKKKFDYLDLDLVKGKWMCRLCEDEINNKIPYELEAQEKK